MLVSIEKLVERVPSHGSMLFVFSVICACPVSHIPLLYQADNRKCIEDIFLAFPYCDCRANPSPLEVLFER